MRSSRVAGQYASPRLSMPRTRMKSGGSREKKTRHLPTRRRSSPGRSLRDFTSPWPVAAKRTRAASIRAWTTRSRRAKSRTAAGRKTTRRITDRAGVGLRPGGHRRPVPRGPDPAWPQSRHRGFPAHPVPPEKKWPPAPHCPEGHPQAIEGGFDRRHVSIITLRAASHLRANMKRSGWSPDPCWQSAGAAFGNWLYSHPDPRLQAAWDDHVVCGAELPERQNPVPDRDAPHACGVAALPETDRPGNAPRPATPPHRGQLCDAQTRKSAQLAEAAPANRYALHADGQFLDEPGGALLRGPDGRLRAGRELRKRASSDRSDRRVSGGAERRAKAVCMARKRGRYPAQDRESEGGAESSY